MHAPRVCVYSAVSVTLPSGPADRQRFAVRSRAMNRFTHRLSAIVSLAIVLGATCVWRAGWMFCFVWLAITATYELAALRDQLEPTIAVHPKAKPTILKIGDRVFDLCGNSTIEIEELDDDLGVRVRVTNANERGQEIRWHEELTTVAKAAHVIYNPEF